MATIDTNYALVLLGRFPGKDRQVGQVLGRVFGRDEAWGFQVVSAAPIIIMDGLTAEQSQAALEALAEVEAAGSQLQVQYNADEGYARIDWPAPPRINGRALSEVCQSDAETSVTLLVPCPYTGQKIKLTISVQAARVNVEPAAKAPAPAPQPQARPQPLLHPQMRLEPRPKRSATPMPVASASPTATPVVPQPAVRVPGPPKSIPVPGLPGHAREVSAPVEIPPPVVGLESLEELVPMEQFPAPPPQARQHSPVRGSPTVPRPPTAGAPLPDVPMLHNAQPPKPVAPPAAPAGLSAPAPVGAPMDLEVFEQKVSSSGMFKVGQAPDEDVEDLIAEAEAENDTGYSVFMGKSTNPKVHQLLAQVQNIAVPEAARICQRTLVAVAKDISAADARTLKQRFAGVNVTVRITQKKA